MCSVSFADRRLAAGQTGQLTPPLRALFSWRGTELPELSQRKTFLRWRSGFQRLPALPLRRHLPSARLGIRAFDMEYRKCIICGFNVTPQDERCGDCGLLYPLEPLRVAVEDYSYLIALVIIAAFLFPALYFGSQAGVRGIFCYAIPVGLLIVALFGGLSKRISNALYKRSQRSVERQVAKRTAPHPASLAYKENIIEQRTSELSKREQQVSAVLERAQLSTGEEWEQVRVTLKASVQTLKRQHARYRAKSVEIETVRLQNRLAPLISDTNRFSYDQIDNHLNSIERARKSAVTLDEQLDEQRRVLGNTSEIGDLAQRLVELQASMNKLRDAFVGQQAVLALKGITPLDDALSPVSRPVAALRETEGFNIQVAITDFSASFDELESEYVRVQTEEDVAQKVSEIISRSDGGRT